MHHAVPNSSNNTDYAVHFWAGMAAVLVNVAVAGFWGNVSLGFAVGRTTQGMI